MVSISPLAEVESCLCKGEVVGARGGLSVFDAEAKVPPITQFTDDPS